MKKHPVDDLFAQKLTSWETTPSESVWQRIQAEQKKKQHRLRGWHWFAAASVAILLVAGYVGWVSEPAMTDLAVGAPSRMEEPSKQLPGTSAEPAAREVLPEQPLPGTYPTEALAAAGTSKTLPAAREINPTTIRLEPATADVPALVADQEIAALHRDEVPATAQPAYRPELKVPDAASVQEVLAGPREIAGDRVVVARVDVEDVDMEEQKPSKLFRVLRQLKNAKEGEAVDWGEVGVNPKKLLARADERLRNEEAKVYKQYNHLKEKIQL
jgi:hypothetical protein